MRHTLLVDPLVSLRVQWERKGETSGEEEPHSAILPYTRHLKANQRETLGRARWYIIAIAGRVDPYIRGPPRSPPWLRS